MLETINIHSVVPISLQFANRIQLGIATGKLKPGDKLPSVRELSERLAVSPNTIAKAYKNLEIRGLLFSRQGIGVFVLKGDKAKLRTELRARLVERIYRVSREASLAGVTEVELQDVVRQSYANSSR